MVIGAFALTDREISLTIVAALLTIVGYSINDTIVVFDRIRENLGKLRKKPLIEIINISINETLSRTILTGTTTLVMLIVLLIAGRTGDPRFRVCPLGRDHHRNLFLHLRGQPGPPSLGGRVIRQESSARKASSPRNRVWCEERRRKPRTSRTAFWVIVLLVLMAFSVVWWVWPGFTVSPPGFDSLFLQKNDDPVRLRKGDTLHLHPHDRLRILDLSTNITFNIGVRMFARGLDVDSLYYEKRTVADLLAGDTLSGERRFRVHIKHRNTDMGHVDLVVGPFVEDWLEKAERVIEPARRVEILQEALKFAPQERRVRARLVEEYLSLQKWPEAAELLETAAKEKPDPEVLLRLVEVYEAMGRDEDTLSTFRRLLDIRPGDTGIRLRYAAALEKAKKAKEAIREYEEALPRQEKHERLSSYRSLGYLYAETGDVPRAALNFQKALELDKADANLHYNLSSLYERDGDEEKALFHLAEALRLKPEDTDGRLRISKRLVEKGKLEEAERQLTQVLTAAPGSMEALLLLTRIAERNKDTAKLKDLYGKILSLDPDNATVLYNLAVAEYEAGNLDKSLPLLQKMARTQPEDRDVQNLLFSIYTKQRKEDLALQSARILISLDPGEIAPYHFLFEYYHGRGDHQAIIETMKQGILAHPENLDLRRYLVLAYLNTGKENLALGQMEEVLRRTPRDAALLLQFARLQEKQGKKAEALETYQKILTVEPGHEAAGEAYLRLRLRVLPHEQS